MIFQEAFNQNFPLEVDRFIEYCNDRNLKVREENLEYLEKEGIFRPLMRVRDYYVNNTSELKELYQQGYVDDPCQRDFVPWEKFYKEKDGDLQKFIHTYYHPYQIYFLKQILNIKLIFTSFSFPQKDDELLRNIREWEEFLKKYLDILRNDSKQNKFVELLLFIQNKYLPFVKQPGRIMIIRNICDSLNNNEKLNNIEEKILPKEIAKFLGLEVEDINKYREAVGGQGLSIDPLANWYDLVKYTDYDKRQKLKGNALLAQDFYLISDMLALFLEDLTDKKPLETGSLHDSMRGRGKERFYGKKLNYIDRDVLIRILRQYGINPRPRLVLIVEGYTEETALPIISNAMNIPLERFDIEIVNIRGIDKDLRELIIYHATPDVYQVDKKFHIHPERTKVFILLDREGNKRGWIKKFIDDPDKEIEAMMRDVLNIIKKRSGKSNAKINEIFLKQTVKHKIWDKSFEYDNFDDDELSQELNKYGKRYNYQYDITLDEIRDCRSKHKNLDDFIREKTSNNTNLNKEKFGEQLANLVADEIIRRSNKFENQRPIEKVLEDIVRFTVEVP